MPIRSPNLDDLRYDRIVDLRSRVATGTTRLQPGETIVGIELAHDLGVGVGDRLTLQAGPVAEAMRVTALVDLGVRELNRRTVIVPLAAPMCYDPPDRHRCAAAAPTTRRQP